MPDRFKTISDYKRELHELREARDTLAKQRDDLREQVEELRATIDEMTTDRIEDSDTIIKLVQKLLGREPSPEDYTPSRYEIAVARLRAFCVKEEIQLTVGGYDPLQLWPLDTKRMFDTDGDPLYASSVQDHITPQEAGKVQDDESD